MLQELSIPEEENKWMRKGLNICALGVEKEFEKALPLVAQNQVRALNVQNIVMECQNHMLG